MKETIKKLLRENLLKSQFKGKDILYHSTNITMLVNILKTNEIKDVTNQIIKTKINKNDDNNYNGVSLTRNSKLVYGDFKLILNGALIKRDYGKNLIPHDWARVTSNVDIGPKSTPSRNNFVDASESEEFLIGPLKNLNKYLLGIQLTRNTNEILSRIEKENYKMANELKELITNISLYDSDFNKLN